MALSRIGDVCIEHVQAELLEFHDVRHNVIECSSELKSSGLDATLGRLEMTEGLRSDRSGVGGRGRGA